jgi:hypothetical protein
VNTLKAETPAASAAPATVPTRAIRSAVCA